MYTALAFYLGKLSIELPIQLVLTFIYASILCKHYDVHAFAIGCVNPVFTYPSCSCVF